MTTVIPLEIRYEIDGEAIESDKGLLLGEYDIAKGDLKTFYLFNPNNSIQADVSQLDTSDDHSTFIPPEGGIIAPRQSAEVSIKYIPQNNLEKLALEEIKQDDLPSENDKLVGKIRWENART
ncbi:MAG: hypothetical protein IIA82_09120 [Thaumarchaeota archaeon]|nr:hypothetical protein [Nitrososphaerota archaeon]